jgi:hypothetical protein
MPDVGRRRLAPSKQRETASERFANSANIPNQPPKDIRAIAFGKPFDPTMNLFVTQYNSLQVEVFYAKSAMHAHQIRAQDRGESIEAAEASFELATWQVIDPERCKLGRVIVMDRYGDLEDGWDYHDWIRYAHEELADLELEGERCEGAPIALTTRVDLAGLLVPAEA